MPSLRYNFALVLCLSFLASCGSSNLNKDNEGFEQKPDLAIKSLRFNDAGFLEYTITNEGLQNIPNPEEGWVYVYVNEQLVSRANIAEDLEDIIAVNGISEVTLPFPLQPRETRVSVIADPDNLISESNELQNSRHQTRLDGAAAELNISIRDLDYNVASGLLQVDLENTGTVDIPQTPATFHIHENGEEYVYAININALAPAEIQTIYFNNSVQNGDNFEVSVTLSYFAETSLEDNSRVEAPLRANEDLDRPVSIVRYAELIENRDILPYVSWYNNRRPQYYEDWTFARKKRLFDMIRALETGKLPVLTEAPEVDEESGYLLHYTEEAALELYLRHLAVTLWVEVNQKVPWSILDYNAVERSNLLSGVDLFGERSGDRYLFKQGNHQKVNSWNPQAYHHFMEVNGLIGDTPRATIEALLGWMMGHLLHVGTEPYEQIYGTPNELVPLNRVLFPIPGWSHLSPSGCWGVTGFLRAMLQAVNIPVTMEENLYGFPRLGGGDHSYPSFMSERLKFAHGDDIYNQINILSGNLVPMEDFLMTWTEFNELIENPELDCDENNRCNRIYEQANFNAARRTAQKHLQYMTDGVLIKYDPENLEAFDESLGTLTREGMPIMFMRPSFTEEELIQHRANAAQTLRDLGNGSLEAGMALVQERVAKWKENKNPL